MNDPQNPSSSPDPFNLVSWGAFHGLSPDDTLIVLCSMLVGLAGEGAVIASEVEVSAVKAPHLLYALGQVQIAEALGKLWGLPRRLNDLYVENSRQYQASALHAGFAGRPYETEDAERSKSRSGGAFDNSVFTRHQKALSDEGKPMADYQVESRARSELVRSMIAVRYEALMRPAFLIDGIRPPDLLNRVRTCHTSHALVIGKGDAWLDAPAVRKTTPWTTLLDGADQVIPANRRLNIPESHRHMRAQLIVEASADAIRQAAAEDRSPLLNRAVMIGIDTANDDPLLDGDDVVAGRHYFDQALRRVITARRSGGPLAGRFREPKGAWGFMKQKRGLLIEIAGSGEGGALAGIVGLADTLALGLQILADKEDADSLVLEWAVPLARRQFHRQLAFLNLCREDSAWKERDRLATRIVEKLREKGPLTRRNLMRCFDRQQAGTYHPVIDHLIEAGTVEVNTADQLSLRPLRRSALCVVG